MRSVSQTTIDNIIFLFEAKKGEPLSSDEVKQAKAAIGNASEQELMQMDVYGGALKAGQSAADSKGLLQKRRYIPSEAGVEQYDADAKTFVGVQRTAAIDYVEKHVTDPGLKADFIRQLKVMYDAQFVALNVAGGIGFSTK